MIKKVTPRLTMMLRDVSPPTNEQLERAREIVARYLEPTPTVTIVVNGRKVFVKLESLQVTGSFKIRGALAAVAAAHRDDPNGAVVTASAGNHGLGIAHASTLLGVRATVVVPANASVAKVKKLSTRSSPTPRSLPCRERSALSRPSTTVT